MSLRKVVQRLFLYIGIALAVLALFAAAIILSKGAVGRVPGAWMALAMFTCGLFWVTIRQSRAYWRCLGFWLAITGLLVVHLLVFVAILRAYPQWREIWFLPVMIVEGALFGAVLYLIFGIREHQ
ncbi:MAG: hypothetical protein WAL52_06740 [Candidatus Sulfotelmatobacter sp.]